MKPTTPTPPAAGTRVYVYHVSTTDNAPPRLTIRARQFCAVLPHYLGGTATRYAVGPITATNTRAAYAWSFDRAMAYDPARVYATEAAARAAAVADVTARAAALLATLDNAPTELSIHHTDGTIERNPAAAAHHAATLAKNHAKNALLRRATA